MYTVVEHTADIRLRLSSSFLKELFKDALLGMMEILEPGKRGATPVHREITVSSTDPTALLIDYLNEIFFYATTYKETYDGISFTVLDEKTCRAHLTGTDVKKFRKDIKAATYHEAEIQKNEKGEYETTIVFDI